MFKNLVQNYKSLWNIRQDRLELQNHLKLLPLSFCHQLVGKLSQISKIKGCLTRWCGGSLLPTAQAQYPRSAKQSPVCPVFFCAPHRFLLPTQDVLNAREQDTRFQSWETKYQWIYHDRECLRQQGRALRDVLEGSRCFLFYSEALLFQIRNEIKINFS